MNQSETRNAVVLVVDGLNSGMLGPYGNTWIETENFNRLAARSLVFDQAFTTSPRIQKAYETLWNVDSDDSTTNLIDLLGSQGVSSTLVSEEDFGSTADSFDRVIPVQAATSKGLATSIEETEMANFFAQALQLLGPMGEESGSLYWLHSKGLFSAWDAPLELRIQLAHEEDPEPPQFFYPPRGEFDLSSGEPDELLGYQQACAAQVFLLDKFLGVVLDLMETPAWSSTLFCLTSTRGFAIGEHGLIGSSACDSTHNECIHVPLLVSLPQDLECSPADTVHAIRNGSLVSNQHVSKIIESWFNPDAEQFFKFWGDLTDPLPDEENEVIVIVDGTNKTIQTHAWKMICSDQKIQLFAKPDDQFEVSDVSRRCPHIIEALTEVLNQVLEAEKGHGTIGITKRIELPDLLSTRD